MTRKDEVAIYGKVLVECVSQRLCDVSLLMNCMILMFPLLEYRRHQSRPRGSRP